MDPGGFCMNKVGVDKKVVGYVQSVRPNIQSGLNSDRTYPTTILSTPLNIEHLKP